MPTDTFYDATNMVPLTYTLAPVTDLLSSDWIDPSIAKNVNKALADYDAEVGVEMQQLQDYLVSKDNYSASHGCCCLWCIGGGSTEC